ncbi:g6f-like isoform X2 [Nelusetta ayraudi]|uniref:g6f-like isoform X2 n=1 Tax=Nelusetta ayraudi TaxID=303726 RepID=UPI003F72C246
MSLRGCRRHRGVINAPFSPADKRSRGSGSWCNIYPVFPAYCAMEFFLAFFLLSALALYSSPAGVREWDDVVVVKAGMAVTLQCNDTAVRGPVVVHWMVQLPGTDDWKLVLLASDSKSFSGGSLKASMQLADANFRDTRVFSLSLQPETEDGGLYYCLITQQQRTLRERIILLAILTVTVAPAVPIPQGSTLRLVASVHPDFAASKIHWVRPPAVSIKSETAPKTGTVAKMPQVQLSDKGAYICVVQPWGNSSSDLFAFNVDVSVDGPVISSAIQALSSFHINCPGVLGDFVRLHWQAPDPRRQRNMTQLYHFDRWRGVKRPKLAGKRLQLAGPPHNDETGNFSFLLKPALRDGGVYVCDVFLNDEVYSQKTVLTVIKVKSAGTPSKLELSCLYSERYQVRKVYWKHQNHSRQLHQTSSLGSITTTLQKPITSDTAGNYICTLQLNNGQTVSAVEAVPLPHEVEPDSVTTPTPPSSLYTLLLLVPLVAAAAATAVCVLLWRQRHSSDGGIEQSLSIRATEAENIYEDPDSVRQAPPEGSVYMVSYCVALPHTHTHTHTLARIRVCLRSCDTPISPNASQLCLSLLLPPPVPPRAV